MADENRTELHKVAAMLVQEEGSYPADLETDYATIRERASECFYTWLKTLPLEMQFTAEEAAVSYVAASRDEAFEDGFAAGIRLITQAIAAGRAREYSA